MDTKLMVYEKNGATAAYNEAIFKKGGWKMYDPAPAAPVGLPVPDDLPHVKEFVDGAVPAAKKPGRPPKIKTIDEE